MVWCVMPTPRMDAVLQDQANYIHQFVTDDENTEENEDGKIWSNVLIVCKGKVGVMSLTINLIFFIKLSINQLSSELAGDVQGAVLAAKNKWGQAKPRTIRNFVTARL